MRRATVVLNPAAGGGRGARLEPRLRRAFALRGVADVRVTAGPGDEARLARAAVADGADTVVAVGGDGTWGRVAGALVEANAALGRDARLALVAAGTGCDFARTLGTRADAAADLASVVTRALGGPDRRVDVGQVDDGHAPPRHFLNALGFGFDAAVIAAVGVGGGARLAYARAALGLLARYPGLAVMGDQDAHHRDSATPSRRLMLVVANGRHFGGLFRIAPAAEPDDGLLDVVAVGDAGPLRRLALFAAAVRGAHVGAPEVRTRRAAALALRFDAPPMYEADGELYQAQGAALAVRCLPGALRVVAPG